MTNYPTQNDQVDKTNFSLPVGARSQLLNPDALTTSHLSPTKVLYPLKRKAKLNQQNILFYN